MTLEKFAHRCLMIKAGNATLDIPCCANCKYYEPTCWTNDGESKYMCLIHPASMYDEEDNPLKMKPEDFCSRWESRNEEKEVKEKN